MYHSATAMSDLEIGKNFISCFIFQNIDKKWNEMESRKYKWKQIQLNNNKRNWYLLIFIFCVKIYSYLFEWI